MSLTSGMYEAHQATKLQGNQLLASHYSVATVHGSHPTVFEPIGNDQHSYSIKLLSHRLATLSGKFDDINVR